MSSLQESSSMIEESDPMKLAKNYYF